METKRRRNWQAASGKCCPKDCRGHLSRIKIDLKLTFFFLHHRWLPNSWLACRQQPIPQLVMSSASLLPVLPCLLLKVNSILTLYMNPRPCEASAVELISYYESLSMPITDSSGDRRTSRCPALWEYYSSLILGSIGKNNQVLFSFLTGKRLMLPSIPSGDYWPIIFRVLFLINWSVLWKMSTYFQKFKKNGKYVHFHLDPKHGCSQKESSGKCNNYCFSSDFLLEGRDD